MTPDAASDAVLPEVEVDLEGHTLRRVTPYMGRKSTDANTRYDVVTPFLESVRMGEGNTYPGILIPADAG